MYEMCSPRTVVPPARDGASAGVRQPEGFPVVQYRRFRNTDPPGLADVWNDAFTGRGGVRLRTSSPLERHAFAKPYFDPEGVIVADEGGRCVGFAHAGFGANAAGTALDHESGVTCLVGVRMTHRRRGIGSELLHRAEDYLRQRGAKKLFAGPQHPVDPFYLGLYGGSELPGILASDPLAAPFLARNGYHPCRTVQVFQRSLAQPLKIVEPRFVAYRQRFELREDPRARLGSWWTECVFGLIEPLEFALVERSSGQRAARALLWEMEGFSGIWGRPSVGMAGVEVRADLRRQAIGKFLIAQALRRIQEQYYEIVEAQAAEDNPAAVAFLRGLGFEQVDTGRLYEKRE